MNNRKRYEVDEAMMGDRWKGSADALKAFCSRLQDRVGDEVEIVPITDSYNGANNENHGAVNDYDWLNELANSPADWWMEVC